MFVVCMVAAAGSIGEYWIKSGTHPVYNRNIKPIAMGPGAPAAQAPAVAVAPRVPPRVPEDPPAATEEEKDAVVEACVQARMTIDTIAEMLDTERNKTKPDEKRIESLSEVRTLFQKQIARHAGTLRKYPELQERIEVEHFNRRNKGR